MHFYDLKKAFDSLFTTILTHIWFKNFLCSYIKEDGNAHDFQFSQCFIDVMLISYKRYLECTLFNEDYQSIPKCTVSCGYLFL